MLKSVDEYYKEINVAKIRANMVKDNEATCWTFRLNCGPFLVALIVIL